MSQAVNKLRKGGKINEAYGLAIELLAKTAPDSEQYLWTQRAYSWVLYSQIKSLDFKSELESYRSKCNEIKDADIARSESMFWENLSKVFYFVLKSLDTDDKATISSFVNTIPLRELFESGTGNYFHYYLHSVFKDETEYGKIINLCGFSHFSDDDFQPFVNQDGKKTLSHVEKVICAYTKSLLKDDFNPMFPQGNKIDVEKLGSWIKIVEDLTNRGKMKFSDYNLAKLYQAKEEIAKAKDHAIAFVKLNSSQFWAWNLLADLEPDTTIQASFLAKAILCKTKSEFLTKTKKRLTDYFISISDWSSAKTLLAQIESISNEKEFNIDNKTRSLLKDDRIQNASLSNSLGQTLHNLSYNANEILYSDMLSCEVAITHLNKDKQLATFYSSKQSTGFFNYSTVPFNIGIGDSLILKYSEQSENGFTQVKIASKMETVHRDIKRVEGKITFAPDRPFSFLNGIFCHKSLVDNQIGTFDISGIAVPKFDKSKERWGQTILKLTSIEKVSQSKIATIKSVKKIP